MNAAAQSLCLGYKNVEAFGPDEEYEEDSEEVSYVTLDLGSIEPTLVPSSTTYRLIGLDTPTPFLQLSGTILKGRHDSLLGTELIFTDGKDPSDPAKRKVTYVASTERRICFREVRLQPKNAGSDSAGPSSQSKAKNRDGPTRVLEDELLAASQMVERVTGTNVSQGRAPRTSKGGPTHREAVQPAARKRQSKSKTRKGKEKVDGIELEGDGVTDDMELEGDVMAHDMELEGDVATDDGNDNMDVDASV